MEKGGSVSCRYCNRKTTFSGPEWLEFLDDGHTFSCLGVRDGLVILHDCRRRSMVWMCPSCGEEAPEPYVIRGPRRKHRIVKTCPHCYAAELVQVTRDPVPR